MALYPVRPVRVRAHIPAPPDPVFAFVADTRNDPLWCRNVDSVESPPGTRPEVGARYRFRQHVDVPGSRRVEFDVDVEVTAMTDRSITWHTVDRFQERVITMTVEAEGEGSRVEQVTEAAFVDPPGLKRWGYPWLARRTVKAQFADLARLFAAAS